MVDLEKLARLSEKATQGEWFVGGDVAHDTIPHKDSGLALIDNGTQEDWPCARLCEWPTANFIAALVNWYRSGGAELARDGLRYRWLRDCDMKKAPVSLWQKVIKDDGTWGGAYALKQLTELDAAIDAARQVGGGEHDV